jgi:FG-GAP-like repeat
MWSQWRLWIFVTAFAVASGLGAAGGQAAVPVFAPPELVLEMPTIGKASDLAAADFNGDGLLDLVVARALYLTPQVFPLVILVNDGTGHFVDATATIFVGPPPVVQHPRKIVIADFNSDGRPDIFIADHGDDRPPFPGFQNQLALSTSDGRLVNATANLPQQSDFTHSAAAADIDGVQFLKGSSRHQY